MWSSTDLNGYIDHALKSLYPTYFVRKIGTSVAGQGPMQTPPAGAKNLYYVGLQKIGSTRAREVRGWVEGDTQTLVPKMGIYGANLFWGWTEGWDAPASDSTALTIPKEAEEAVVLRSQIHAMERLLSSRTHFESYQTLLASREGVTEQSIDATIRALRESLQAHETKALPLPVRKDLT